MTEKAHRTHPPRCSILVRWDAAGNLGLVSTRDEHSGDVRSRFLFWTEDNRLHTVVDDRYHSYYAYDHAGERTLKITGPCDALDVSAWMMHTHTQLHEFTIYPSPYLVVSNHGYTKHYYAGTERLAARQGGGFGKKVLYEQQGGITGQANTLFKQSLDNILERRLQEDPGVHREEHLEAVFGKMHPGVHAPQDLIANAGIYNSYFLRLMGNLVAHAPEREVYFYHSDHLGSASWITDADGTPVQHLQYLPYGEPFVNQRVSDYSERFTFTGKERDEETGYSYFGARYMDHELMTMWLSVDPLSDKYPSITPYNYCMWNPIKVVDPNGMDTIVFDGNGNFSNRIKADGKHMGRALDNNGNKMFDFEFACQQDADRCCSPGSPEEFEIMYRDKLQHGKDCPAEETAPIHRIELVWQKDIVSMLKESGACDKSFLPRIYYALRESDGGKLDFANINRNTGDWNDRTLYIPMVSRKKYAHNASNMGNFLWGAAMHKMGISYRDAMFGSNLHALIKHREFDSRDDQLSIGLGYSYSIRLNQLK